MMFLRHRRQPHSQLEYLDGEIIEEAKEERAKDREEQIRYTYECYGGVPVNIDVVQPAKASCVFSSFVAGEQYRISQGRVRRGDGGTTFP